jgi:cytochrome c556
MRTTGILLISALLLSVALLAQAPADPFQPVATMKQLMVEIIYPASNEILLVVNRGGPSDDNEWAAVRRSAMTLAESGNLLIMRNRASVWVNDAKTLIGVGTSAYQAAQSKDGKALAALIDPLDASCTTCHKQFRPSVFPSAR